MFSGCMTLGQIFGINVRTARSGKGWSQEDLANACALDRTYISGIERATRNPTLKIVDKIASALGVEPSDLLIPHGKSAENPKHN